MLTDVDVTMIGEKIDVTSNVVIELFVDKHVLIGLNTEKVMDIENCKLSNQYSNMSD